MSGANAQTPAAEPRGTRPRLGFLGVGWIGRHRLEAIVDSGVAEVVAIGDPSAEARNAVLARVPTAAVVTDVDALCASDLDGVVIATPSALHATQAVAALEAGLAVFCQKPLARTKAETLAVIEAARRADRLLGVDMSYRFAAAVRALQELARSGTLGQLFAGEFVFHNAYGPDKAWFRDPALSGGGCLVDLGVHLVDLALEFFGGDVTRVDGKLFRDGRPLEDPAGEVEDYATVRVDFAAGATAAIACSWNLHAGRDAVIEVHLHGTTGGAALRNVNGSFLDFVAEVHDRTATRVLCTPPDDWGGRAAVHWAEALAAGRRYDCEVESLVPVAAVIDRAYGRSVEP